MIIRRVWPACPAYLKYFLIVLMSLFVSCGGGGSGGSGSNDKETSINAILSGQATIPGYQPNGPLWIVADGLDGISYGSSASDAQGNFSFDVTLTGQSESVLIYAVDPNDPEMYVMALVPVADIAKGALVSSDTERMPIYINGESTAEVFVSIVSGLPPNEFTPLEQALVDDLVDQYVIEAPNLCSVEQTPIFIENEITYVNSIRAFFDVFVNEEGSLKLRVKRAQDKATKYVTSLNQATGWRLDKGTGLLTTLSLVRTRATLRVFLGEEFGLSGGLTSETISREDLETAANIIVNPESITGGYGNCREKGIVGAYIASRFDEFKQVAFVAAETELYSQPHGFAIACQQDETVWDIIKLMDKLDTDVPVPEGLYEADCMIIDPWAGIALELTPRTVESLKWKWIEHVMKVDLSETDANANQQVYNALTNNSRAAFIPEAIPSDDEFIAAICEPFTIPQDGQTGSDEICDDGIDNDGDGVIDCDDDDCSDDPACASIDISDFSHVRIVLNSLFVNDENPDTPHSHASTMGDYGMTGTVSGDAYAAHESSTSADGRWKQTVDIDVTFDQLHRNILFIDYQMKNEDTRSQYQELHEFITKSGIRIPLSSVTSLPMIFQASGIDAHGNPEVCNIVEYFHKRRYRSDSGELFDYVEHYDCDDSSIINVEFSE